MDRFITCACNGDLKVLIKSGDPTAEELDHAWLSIKSQHIENLKEPDAVHKVNTTLDMIDYEWKCKEVNTLLALLFDGYDESVITLLQEYDYDYPFTEDTYLDDIPKVQAELAIEGMEYAAFRESILEAVENAVPEKETYYMTITMLQKHLGLCYGLSPMKAAKELTVYEFGFSLKEYNKQARAKQKAVQDVNAGYE